MSRWSWSVRGVAAGAVVLTVCSIGAAWAATQEDAGWNLARISQRERVAATGPYTYRYDAAAGEGVSVYVLSTGINVAHLDFEGRARFMMNVTGDEKAGDCSGQGTHLAGVVGGKTYGVAKKAQLIDVKVARCDGNATADSVIAGIKAAVADARGTKGNVILIAQSEGKSEAVNRAVEDAYRKGFVVVVPAGNDNQDACNVSPASAPNALTTGATNIDDRKASWSNSGKCVDVLAPGQNILSVWTGGNTATATRSGTAMAAAHTAGIAATLLSARSLTAAQVSAQIVRDATKNAVRDLPSTTPNLLLYSGIF
ncbi:S8 family peptidase [Streptomyces sp. ISL-43]|uniref:S8 family peptidase n=1 Tax=Streptomyces sp. ISL-43 TaxID=2819183 RepID=UPI001BEAF188|nr:S8 family peptidase [Streptomyces sp. ISL-43]MBT2453030.1 S8 family peptidase [Streptomyces sp. ISL-43]